MNQLTLYEILAYLHAYYFWRMNRTERLFVKKMWEAAKGVGGDPTDQLLIEQCGFSEGRIKFVNDIARRFRLVK